MDMLSCRRSSQSQRTTSLDNNDVEKDENVQHKRCVMKFIVLQLLSYSPLLAIHKEKFCLVWSKCEEVEFFVFETIILSKIILRLGL